MNLGHLKAGHVRAADARRGFTLIELLVVIAIIGILSSVVLASLNTARSRGNDAKIESQLKNMQSAMALYQTGAGNYGTSSVNDGCTTAPAGVWADATSGMAALSNESNYPANSSLTCYTTGTGWAAQATLSDANYFCVDSNGLARTHSANMLASGSDVSCL